MTQPKKLWPSATYEDYNRELDRLHEIIYRYSDRGEDAPEHIIEALNDMYEAQKETL